nr:ATP-grasp domain-containing protein [uncultured Blautia sp.]
MREYIVLVTKEHYNPLGIVRTLGEAGIRPVVVAVNGNLKFVGQSKYVKEKYYVDSTEEGINLIIDKYADSEEKSFILTGDDVTVAMLDKYYDRLKDYFYFYNAGEKGRIAHYMNKDVMLDLVVKYGIKIAKTWKVKVNEIPKDIVYPIMTKAINSLGSEWKDIVYICHNDAELIEAFKHMKSEKVLLQQYIEKVDEFSFDAISVNRGKDVWVIIEANQIYNIPDKYSPYWVIKNSKNKKMQEKIEKVIGEIGLEGIFEFEFIQDREGALWFLEINFRNTALGYSTTVAGMPQVVYWCESMEKGFIDREKYYKDIPEGMTAMAECFDYDVRVKTGVLSKEEWLKQYMSTECKMYMGRDDYVPFQLFMEYKQKYMH